MAKDFKSGVVGTTTTPPVSPTATIAQRQTDRDGQWPPRRYEVQMPDGAPYPRMVLTVESAAVARYAYKLLNSIVAGEPVVTLIGG